MVSEHAMLILMLLLAVAVVVLAAGLMIYARKMDVQLKSMASRLDELGGATAKGGSAE